LHSGRESCLVIEPSDEDLSLEAEGERLPLSQLALDGTARGSDLFFPSGKRVRTCEHVLSALVGLGVWRAKLVVSGSEDYEHEMPGLDGCSSDLTREIMEKSTPSAEGPIPFKLQYPMQVGDLSGDKPRFIVALPSRNEAENALHITAVIDYDAAPIGTQIFEYGAETDYGREIAPARTFVMRSDVESLRAAGLALGGSLDNAIVVNRESVSTAGGLRFSDEFVRHKVLDLLGDLANLGRPLAAHIVAVRAGHAQHLQLVERLRAVSRIVV
jgi:UDP-3-O-[3-hydroxymyristoyl] N-acetylglucosamine deacetylase